MTVNAALDVFRKVRESREQYRVGFRETDLWTIREMGCGVGFNGARGGGAL